MIQITKLEKFCRKTKEKKWNKNQEKTENQNSRFFQFFAEKLDLASLNTASRMPLSYALPYGHQHHQYLKNLKLKSKVRGASG